MIREYKIWGEINEYALQCLQEFFMLNADNTDEIRLTFLSEGGSVIAGNAMHDLIKNECSTRKISGRIYFAFSIAAIVVCAIPVENLEICEHGTLMFHNVKTSGFGMDEKDLRAEADIISKMQSILENALVKRTGLSLEAVKAKFFNGSDIFVLADEAVSLGICGKICGVDSMEVVIPAELEMEIETMMSEDVREDKYKGHLSRLFNKFNFKNKKPMAETKSKSPIDNSDAVGALLKTIEDQKLSFQEKELEYENKFSEFEVQKEALQKDNENLRLEISKQKTEIEMAEKSFLDLENEFKNEKALNETAFLVSKYVNANTFEDLINHAKGINAIWKKGEDGKAYINQGGVWKNTGKDFDLQIADHLSIRKNANEIRNKAVGLPTATSNTYSPNAIRQQELQNQFDQEMLALQKLGKMTTDSYVELQRKFENKGLKF
jgi:ATP-dependent protease ClpP protease subunit